MKMIKRYTLFAAVALAALSACTPKDDFEGAGKGRGDGAIELSCAISRPEIAMNLGTKATIDYKGVLESTTEVPDGYNLRVGLVRVDRTMKDLQKYGDEPDQGLVFRAGMAGLASFTTDSLTSYTYSDDNPHYYFTDGELGGLHNAGLRKIRDFYNAQYFRGNDNIVQYVSWYPFGTVNGNTTEESHKNDPFTVTENLDLKTDVLYSDIATETMNKEYNDIITYKHALCQFRIYVYRMVNKVLVYDSEGLSHTEEVNVWGKLEDIITKKECTSLTLQLPGHITYNYPDVEAPGYAEHPNDFSLSASLPHATITNGVYSYPEGSNGVFFVTDETADGDTDTNTGVILPVGLEQKKLVACYLAAPPDKGLLQYDISATSTTSEKTITIANEYKPGYAYDIVLCFSDHGIINSEISIGKWEDAVQIQTDVAAEMYYDLSRYGTANSYIVSSSNLGYSFNGLVKGCGNIQDGGSIVGLSDADCTLPSDSYIDILYCEPSDLLALRSNRLVDGSVLFKVPGYPEEQNPHPGTPDYRLFKKGNAIIVARSGQGGDILWSWHIWVTDRPLEIGNNNGYQIMDRNLGALESPKTKSLIEALSTSETDGWDSRYYGFYYQWGRKDPMIPGWTITGAQNELVSIEDGVKHPDKFYGYTYSTRGYDWIDPSKNTGVNKMALWGYKESADYIKTVYDPCPPGYRVPELKCWTQRSGVDFHNFLDPSIGGYKLGVFNINGMYTWYPSAGWIDSDDQPQTPGSPIVVAHTVPRDYSDAYCYVAEQHENTDVPSKFGGNVFNATTVAGYVYRLNNADACPVRCISTASESIVKDLSKAQTANCYVVPESGTYKFKADVRGNGTTKVTTSNGSYPVLESPANIDHALIHHVAVLWWQGDLSGETGTSGTYGGSNSAGTDCPIHFVRSEGDVLPRNPARSGTDFTDADIAVVDAQGYVKFHIDDEKYCHGNALIAAFDSDNKILWSWHIWLTDNPGKVKFGPRTIGDHTYTYYCMDRNLGATYCPTSTEISNKNFGTNNTGKRLGTLGLYYQWGRKDPIQGPTATTGTTGTASSRWYIRDVANGYVWTAKDNIQVADGVRNRSDAIEVPATFLRKSATAEMNNWNDTDWKLDANYNQFTAMWGYPSGHTNATYDPYMTKTMNDPCPPGYYMPPHYFFAAGHLGASGQDNSRIEYTFPGGSGDTNGLFATPGDTWTVAEPIWFPFAGYRTYDSGNITSLGSIGAYHSGLDMAKTNTRVFRLENTGGGQIHLPPGTAASVRCRAY